MPRVRRPSMQRAWWPWTRIGRRAGSGRSARLINSHHCFRLCHRSPRQPHLRLRRQHLIEVQAQHTFRIKVCIPFLKAQLSRIYIHRIFIRTQHQCEVRVNRLRQFEFRCYRAGCRHIDTIGFSFRPLLVFRIAHIKEGLGKTELHQH